MVVSQQAKCDICNKPLADNEVTTETVKTMGIINNGTKLVSKNSIDFKQDGVMKHGDLCTNCRKILTDVIDKLKIRYNKK